MEYEVETLDVVRSMHFKQACTKPAHIALAASSAGSAASAMDTGVKCSAVVFALYSVYFVNLLLKHLVLHWAAWPQAVCA